MKTFYRLIHGDCKTALSTLTDESVNLILIDPPYGINKNKILGDDSLTLYYDVLPDLYRVLKNNSFFLTCCSIEKIPQMFKKNPFTYRWMAICYCTNNMVRGNVGFANYLPLLIFMKGYATYNKQLRDVFEYAIKTRSNNRQYHPYEKPVSWFKKLIASFSSENEVVLDAFLGSGTTMKAAQEVGRSCIGIEIDEKYCAITKQRCFGRQFLNRDVEYVFEEA